MYHCQLHFYLSGGPCRTFEIIKQSAPLDSFCHEFMESGYPEASLAAGADVIFADLHNLDAKETVRILAAAKSENAELIVLADKKQIDSLFGELSEIKDIWILPMEDEEIKFRFFRWQQTVKMEKDFWQTSPCKR